MSEWQDISTAPRDGSWFLVLLPVTIVGGGPPRRANPELLTIRRTCTSPDSGGYWQSIWGHSVANSHIGRHARWAPLSALPLVEMWSDIEAERLRQGGEPMPLPVPLAEIPQALPR